MSSETFVQGIINDFQNAITVVDADLQLAIEWLNGHIAAVATGVSDVVTGIEAVLAKAAAAGITLPAGTQTAINDANAAVAGLNAIAAATATNTGQPTIAGTAQALVDGYVAAKTALAATSTAAAALAAQPSAEPAIPVSTPAA